ncbi:hypothetical protein BGZ91_007283, partial [Linnemannia elongata]
VREVAFSPTGQQVASASNDNSIRLWDARTGAAVFVMTDNIDEIACVGRDKTIRIFDTLAGLLVLETCKDDFHDCVTYSHDGQLIATGSGNRLQLWEAEATTFERGRGWEAHMHGISSIAFSPDDRWIASCSWDRTVKMWDSGSGLLASSFVNHTDFVNCVRFSPDGSLIASASNDNTLRLWEVNSLGTGLDSQDTVNLHLCATYSPDGRQLITGSRYTPMRQFNADSGDVEFVFPDHLQNTYCIAFSPDGLQIAIGGSGQAVILWSVESRATSFVFRTRSSSVSSVAFSPCGRWLASGGFDSKVHLWDTRSGAAGHVLNGHEGFIQSVTFSPDGRWIALAYMNGKIQIWEVGTGELKADRTIDVDLGGINVVVYKPGCLQVASCHGDGTIRLWDDDQQLQGFRYIVKQRQFSSKFGLSSCGQWAATAHLRCVRLWKLPSPDQDQQELSLQDQDCDLTIEGFTAVVSDVVWRPNKLEFATTSHEGSIRAWKVVEDKDGSGRVSVQLLWSSGSSSLTAFGAALYGVVGLSPINRKLLEQRGAITVTL